MTETPERDDPLDQRELDALWDFDDPAASEARFRERLARMTPGAVSAAELETQLARALGLQNRFDKADVVLDGVKHDHPVVRTRIALERGRLRNSAGDPAAAIPYFREAVTHAEAAGNDALAIDAERAEAWTRRGLERAEDSADPRARRWRGLLHNNLGWTLHDRGEYAAALPEFEAALSAHAGMGTTHRALGHRPLPALIGPL